MNRVITTILLLTLAAATARAQGGAATEGARLIDSFGAIQISDLMARLDNFAIELQNAPHTHGFVVAYGAKHKFPGWPLRRGRYALMYLTETRGLDAARLSVVNGGLRDETAFELWVVNPGGELPVKPFDAALLMTGEKAPVPFDRFSVTERGDPDFPEIYQATPYPDSAGLYDYFAEVLRRDPGLRGCVIGYTFRRGSRAADRRIASRAKLAIAKAHAVDLGRLFAVGGGRREYKMVELWLVPPGAPLPRPTPEARPARRRRP